MAHNTPCAVHDLGPSETSALAAAYDSVVQSLNPKDADKDPLLHYSLACHLMAAAFGGERDPDLLRKRAIVYVAEWFETRTPAGISGGGGIAPVPLMRSVTRIELGEILLAEAQKTVPAHTSYPGHVTVYAQEITGPSPNWTIQGFTPWTSDTEQCRQSLGAAERELKNSYRVR